MKQFIFILMFSFHLFAKNVESKVNCNPSLYLQAIEDVYKSADTISDFLISIQKTKNSFLYPNTVSASQSFSLQSSKGLADPRIYLENDCLILTITLLGNSIEYAIKKQNPDNSKRKGILLGHLGPFPKTDAASSITESIHQLNPSTGKTNLRCTSCHVDVAHKEATNSHLGFKILDYKKENLLAVVSPFFHKSTDKPEGTTYCASDLRLIEKCLCKPTAKSRSSEIKNCDLFFSKAIDDKSFQLNDFSLNSERCERIQSVNTFLSQLKDKMNLFYKPSKCVFVK